MASTTIDKDVSSFDELINFVERFQNKHQTSKVANYLHELKECLEKEENIEKIKRASDNLYHAFPEGDQDQVRTYLKELVLQDKQLKEQKKKDVKEAEKEQSMASQRSNMYSWDDFENEVNRIAHNSEEIGRKLKDIKKSLQNNKNNEVDVMKQAVELQKVIEEKASEGLKEEGIAFLQHLQKNGCLPESNGNKGNSLTTKIDVIKVQEADGKAKVHQANKTNNTQETGITSARKPGFGGAETPKLFEVSGQADSAKQIIMSATVPGPARARAQEPSSASGEKDYLNAVLQMIKELYSSSSFDISKAYQSLPAVDHAGYEILSLFNKLKEENDGIKQSLEKSVKTFKDQNKADKDHIASLEAQIDNQIKEKDEMKRSHNDYVSKQAKEMEDCKTEKRKIQVYGEKMQMNVIQLKQDLQKLEDESNRQKFKLGEQIDHLTGENKQLKSRVSELAGAKLMDNNPDIADLSDPNRALKLSEKFSSLYDDDWTDTFQTLTEKFQMKDHDAISLLLKILLKSYEYCRRVADEQMIFLCNIFEHPCQNIPEMLTKFPKDQTQLTQKQRKDLKDLRKRIALNQSESVAKQFLNKEYEEAKKGDRKQKKILEETRIYYEKCVEVCWPMVLHDPPVNLEMKIKPGVEIDVNRFRLYGGNGGTLEYLVWPPLVVEGGGLLAKGVAKPKEEKRTGKKP